MNLPTENDAYAWRVRTDIVLLGAPIPTGIGVISNAPKMPLMPILHTMSVLTLRADLCANPSTRDAPPWYAPGFWDI